MERVSKFEKISYYRFYEDWTDTFGNIISDDYIKKFYDNIKLPQRATKNSAGYDFFAPFEITLNPGETAIILTGIRCKINEGWFLQICPRSSLGFKYRIRLENTIGIIDGDYYDSDNEGHIVIKISNENSSKIANIYSGDKFVQGIFLPHGITIDDCSMAIRNGGFGSTN